MVVTYAPSSAAAATVRPHGVRERLARLAAHSARLGAKVAGGRATVMPGYVALRVMPDLLSTLLSNRVVCVVSGTNGKTTTTALIAAALGGDVATNSDGANLPAGWTTTLLDADPSLPAVLEVDEAYVPAILDAAPGALAVLLNLTRDQLDRHSETRMLARRWRDALASHPGVRVVANADDPLVVWAARAASDVTWAAGGAAWHLDAAVCPECDAILEHPESGWRCAECRLQRPDPQLWMGDGRLHAFGGEHIVRLALPGRANRGNVTIAVAAAHALGVPVDDALAAAANVREVSGRYGRHLVDGRELIVLLAKNPAGWVETLDVIDDILPIGQGTVVVAINAHGPDGRDPSWLWDVPFERLAGRRVVATGERATDLAVRLDHAGVTYEKDTRPPLTAARSVRSAPGEPIVIAATYSNFLAISRALAGDD